MSDKNEAAAKQDDQPRKDNSAPAAPNVHKLSDEELKDVSGGATVNKEQARK